MTKTLELYRFKTRNPANGKWSQTRYCLTLEEAAKRFGEGNYEVLEWTKEVREVGDPDALSAAHLYR